MRKQRTKTTSTQTIKVLQKATAPIKLGVWSLFDAYL